MTKKSLEFRLRIPPTLMLSCLHAFLHSQVAAQGLERKASQFGCPSAAGTLCLDSGGLVIKKVARPRHEAQRGVGSCPDHAPFDGD